MNACVHHPPQVLSSERFFAVGPVRELGDDLARAVQQLGGDAHQRRHHAHGFVVVSGRGYGRLAAGLGREEAIDRVRGSKLRLGEAVALVGGQVLYREVPHARDLVEKAIDPRSPDGFLRIVNQIARALRGATGDAEKDAVRRAIDRLDVDWPNLSVEAHAEVVRAANLALSDLPAIVLPKVDEVLGVEANRVVLGTR